MDWARIEGFEWDQENARKSHAKHGVSQAEAEQMFFNQPLLIVEDLRHSEHERAATRSGKPTTLGRCMSPSPCAAPTRESVSSRPAP